MNSQQQLLQILQIKPVQLHADFLHFQPFNEVVLPVSATVSSTEINDINLSADLVLSNQIPVEFDALAADIQRALQLYLPDFPWCWSAQLQQSELNGTEIHTPDLAALMAPVLKQQLWQLMAQYVLPQQADQDEPN